MRSWNVAISMACSLVLLLAACSDGDDDEATAATTAPPTTASSPTTSSPTTGEPAPPALFSPQANNLEAYTTTSPYAHQTVVTTRETDPDGWDINGQICFLDATTFISGEDTGQPEITPGWGVFTLAGDTVGAFAAERVGRLVPTYPASDAEPDNYGCGVLSDGRVVTTTIGNTASGETDGQLLLWFPPFDDDVAFCVVDDTIGTAQQIAVGSDDAVYVASARGDTAGVLRFTASLPATPGACAPVTAEPFVRAGAGNPLAAPNGIAPAPSGGWYVSSIINGLIVELDAAGAYVRTVLAPPEGETLGASPFSTGTPLGLATGPDGTLYYADLGLVVDGDGFGPRAGTGTVRAIAFADGEPTAPAVIADDLTFPDGLGVRP